MEYNLDQIVAIKSKERNIIVIAPPGSGKTQTMIGAIQEFVTNEQYNKVVAITFTKKAAEELNNRLYSFNKGISISTIHSWSLSQLNILGQKYGFRVKLLEEPKILEIIQPFMDEYRVHRKAQMLCYWYVMGNVNPDLNLGMKAKFEAIKTKYNDFKRERLLYDFTDLPLYLKDKLLEYEEFISLDGLFVDEFQDVDPSQLEVFNRVKAFKKFFIGDIDQAIYYFRGATENIFNKLRNFQTYQLNYNYRSLQPIIDFAYSFKEQEPTYISETVFIPSGRVISKRDSKDLDYCKIFIETPTSFKDVVNKIGLPIAGFLQNELNKPYQVLCRTNKMVKQLRDVGFINATTIHQAKGLEYDNILLIDFPIEDQENINVAFVGITRAKNKLIIADLDTVLTQAKKMSKEQLQIVNALYDSIF